MIVATYHGQKASYRLSYGNTAKHLESMEPLQELNLLIGLCPLAVSS